MKKLLFILPILLALTSCSNADNDPKEEAKTKADSILSFDEIQPKKNLPKRLNNTNIEEHLVKFGEEHQDTEVIIKTKYGNIKLRLYKDTPLHRANFLQIIDKGIYKNTQFSRVVKGFVIQGGSSDDVFAMDQKFYLGDYTIPSEMSTKHIHKYGALAMSRDYVGNPEKRSDAFDFYIVIGEKILDRTIYQIQKEKDIKYTQKQISTYKSIGGTPHLDLEHTVFGEVISGMDVVKKINNLEVDASDWPKESVYIDVERIEQ